MGFIKYLYLFACISYSAIAYPTSQMLDIEKDELAALLQRENSAFRDLLYHKNAGNFEKSDSGKFGSLKPQNNFPHLDLGLGVDLDAVDQWNRYKQANAQRMQDLGVPVNARQHWSYEFMPGGRRAAWENANVGVPVSRQHWSYEYMPGGRRSAGQHAMTKRQHWSKGYSPGGKRSVDLSEFDDQGRRITKHEGMPEEPFKVEQPRPRNGIHGPAGLDQNEPEWKNWMNEQPAVSSDDKGTDVE
ncbi:preprogonadotropin-releasing hormone 1 [Ciona intestinalis]